MVAHQAAIFFLFGSSWQVRERTGYKFNHEYSLVKKNMAENEILNASA